MYWIDNNTGISTALLPGGYLNQKYFTNGGGW